MKQLWSDSVRRNVERDSYFNSNASLAAASRELKCDHLKEALGHVHSLTVQGASISSILNSLNASSILCWSKTVNQLPTTLMCFTRKALQQQLPTFANLFKWKKSTTDLCPLCQKIQTNKHVLNNCASPSALDRFKMRHDEILQLLCTWIKAQTDSSIQLIADVVGCNQIAFQDVFQKFRPDIVVLLPDNNISIWELTICHETNIEKSRAYKREKYSSLADDLMPKYRGFRLSLNTIEVTSLGLMSDKLSFNFNSSVKTPPVSLFQSIARSVISNSYNIYRNRNFV